MAFHSLYNPSVLTLVKDKRCGTYKQETSPVQQDYRRLHRYRRPLFRVVLNSPWGRLFKKKGYFKTDPLWFLTTLAWCAVAFTVAMLLLFHTKYITLAGTLRVCMFGLP